MNNANFLHQSPQNEEPEKVDEELWQWEATYNDGSIHRQFNYDEMTFHQFSSINQSELAVFKMISPIFPHCYSLVFEPKEMKLIHFYRNIILNAGTGEEKRVKLYCFGYEDRNHQKHIFAITPESELIITDDPELIIVE